MKDLEKEFVPYPLALRMKALGFDKPCFGWFTDYQHLYIDKIINGKIFNSNNGCLAPTFSQAFRWFREKYNLYHNINVFGDWDKPQFSYIVSGKTMDNPAHMWHFENSNSYEEAELACLEKLLEIVEKQNK